MSHAVAVADRPARRHGGHLVLAALAVAAAVAVLATSGRIHPLEARGVAAALAPLADGGTAASGNVAYFGIGTATVHGIQITPMCSSVVLVVPLLLLSAVLALVTRGRRTPRVALALTASVVLVVACNTIRYLGSALALQAWGEQGFDVVHEYAGSLFVIAGFAAAFLLQLGMTLGRSRPARGRGRRSAGREPLPEVAG
ncbi:exosortase S [Microbacterium sp. M1A1_1b]|uniref:exosortase S n=1 Tax=Curtobacterium sp. VKM Ac-2922 TaxID=2929475 RepID=UPI001FB43C1B|nr:exosortase S [Curtobacterium sp. VKM Ac-2922]MCJ1713477.1 exosortase S [Curtobacterium sp. VKM Ac-2922]